MPERTDLIYTCDGTLWGVLCCVFESYTRHEVPCNILTNDDPILFSTRQIVTDQESALRVYRSLALISDEVCDWVNTGYIACTEGREMMLYQFIRLAYRYGARVTSMLTNKVVCETFKAVRIVRSEAHWMREFLRFSDYNGALVAEIEPKYLILPLIQEHFTSRFTEETFMIFDRAHGMALFYRPYEAVIQEIDELKLPSADETEQAFRAFWRRYYHSIAIEGRFNPKCRMSHMPKRFWKHMTEMAPAQLEDPMHDQLTISEKPRLKGFRIE